MLPCDAKKNYNPCAVSVNKYEPCILWAGIHTTLLGGAWAGDLTYNGGCGERAQKKSTADAMLFNRFS